MMRRGNLFQSHSARGFSLVELMVGIVVAMVAVIVVMQVFRVSEGQRRTTTGGDDAQTVAAVAMNQLQRDIRQAGQGLAAPELLACQLDLGPRSIPVLAPVTINPTQVPEGDPHTDVVMVQYGLGLGGNGNAITAQAGATYTVSGARAYALNTRVIATPFDRAAVCSLKLTTVSQTPADQANVTVAQANGDAVKGILFDFGLTPRIVVYAVRSQRLTVCDYMQQDCTSNDPLNWSELAEGIVSLRAQYVTGPGVFTRTTPAANNVAGWGAIVGVRVALVARSRQAEREDVVAPDPSWSGSAAAPITLTDSDWRRYRYKTVEAMLPLRNVQ